MRQLPVNEGNRECEATGSDPTGEGDSCLRVPEPVDTVGPYHGAEQHPQAEASWDAQLFHKETWKPAAAQSTQQQQQQSKPGVHNAHMQTQQKSIAFQTPGAFMRLAE